MDQMSARLAELSSTKIRMQRTLERRGTPLQVRSAAELKSREEVETSPAVKSFKFKEYMMQRADLVNQALDKAVPLQYPEAVVEAMRSVALIK